VLPTFADKDSRSGRQCTAGQLSAFVSRIEFSQSQELGSGNWFRYHSIVRHLTEQLLKTIRKQDSIHAGDRVAAAVSGGADSVALLCLLVELRAELGIVLSVAHVNHKLRGEESDEDERFVAELAERHGLELHVSDAPVDVSERAGGSGIEAAARELRYGFFRQLAREGKATKIATAHTLDDQAETVLLRIFRGTGIRGLAGIHPRIVFEEDERAFGEVVRPLLGFRRASLQEFLRERGQSWREDSSNREIGFLRNRVRHRLLPVISEEFGEGAIEHMSELAEIARAEDEHWRGHPEVWDQLAAGIDEPGAWLSVKALLSLSLAAQRRLVRAWLETRARDMSVSFRMIEEALELAHGSSGRKLELTGGWVLRFEKARIWLDREQGSGATDYEYMLALPGVVEIPELGACTEARLVDVAEVPQEERRFLLDAGRVPKRITIRNWRAGDRYWPAHTAAEKKVKELLNDRHVTGLEKKLWPVAVAEGCGLIWLRGFSAPAAFAAGMSKAVWIRERDCQ